MSEFQPMTSKEIEEIRSYADANGSVGFHSAMRLVKQISHLSWADAVERIRSEHNGVMSVDLHFGHDGDMTCRFRDYEKVLAEHSCDSMQRSVESCIAQLNLERSAGWSTKHAWEDFTGTL